MPPPPSSPPPRHDLWITIGDIHTLRDTNTTGSWSTEAQSPPFLCPIIRKTGYSDSSVIRARHRNLPAYGSNRSDIYFCAMLSQGLVSRPVRPMCHQGRFRALIGGALDHRWQPPEFESRRGHIWRAFHLWLRYITFGGRSAQLAYHVHKRFRKTSIIIIIIINPGVTRSRVNKPFHSRTKPNFKADDQRPMKLVDR